MKAAKLAAVFGAVVLAGCASTPAEKPLGVIDHVALTGFYDDPVPADRKTSFNTGMVVTFHGERNGAPYSDTVQMACDWKNTVFGKDKLTLRGMTFTPEATQQINDIMRVAKNGVCAAIPIP